MADVLFIAMPFGPVFTPSIGLSLLQAELTQGGISSQIEYLSIPFAERLGSRVYTSIAQSQGIPIVDLAGEWIFARELAGPSRSGGRGYIRRVLRAQSAWAAREGVPRLSDSTVHAIVEARGQVAPFLDQCVTRATALAPRVVGFTSSFQQHAASLALARRLKAALPGVFILMGGANCEGVMGAETVRQFPFVDAVVSGEADLIIVDLVRRLLDGRSIADIEGVRTRSSIAREFAFGRFSNAPLVRDMNALPYPDYRDYVRQFDASRLSRHWQFNMLFESSRGCWWGEKAHCTFCGLNGSTMTYRSKTADRALAELRHLATTYPGSDVQVVDNILEMSYFRDLLPLLKRQRLSLDLFYETKSNLKKEQIRLLADAGVTRIQPGIESFSDPVLTLMRKGVTWLQNVQLLKWCKQFGVVPYWNLLWGFPGEPAAEYERMAAVVPSLTHLPAPVGASAVRLDRFSPNFNQADRLGFAKVRPIDPYRDVFVGLPDHAIANLAYYFSFDYADGRDVAAYVRPLDRQLARWQRLQPRSELVSIRRRDRLVIYDLRPAASASVTILRGLDRTLYEACDAIVDLRRLTVIASTGAVSMADPADVVTRLQPLVDRGLLATDGLRYLALAIPMGAYQPPAAARARIRRLTSALDRQTRRSSVKEQSWQRRRVARKRPRRRRVASSGPR